jgi:hypothetical protein
MYPSAIPQPLYEASDVKRLPLGTVAKFHDSSGNPILARYMSNDAGATLPAGGVVARGGHHGHIGGAAATNTPPAFIARGLAASLASVTGGNGVFGWVIFDGLQTNASASASAASSAADRALAWQAANLLVAAATYASTTAGYAQVSVCALLKAGDALAAAASNSIYWVWR